MKKIFYLIIPAATLFAGCGAWVQTAYEPAPVNNPTGGYSQSQPDYQQSGFNDNYPDYDNSPQTDQVFYDELSRYGRWVDYPDYGYVWVPNVGDDFRPYATNGNWVYSDYGWTWASDYDWGWATFHYG